MSILRHTLGHCPEEEFCLSASSVSIVFLQGQKSGFRSLAICSRIFVVQKVASTAGVGALPCLGRCPLPVVRYLLAQPEL